MKYCHVLALAFLVTVLCACGRRATPLPKDFATLGTGPLSGAYYPVGGAICRLMLKDESSKFRLAVEPSDGPAANLAALLKGDMDFGLVPLDILEKSPGQGLRAVLALRLDAGPPVILTTTERVDAALVRAVAKAVSYNFDELKASHPSLAGLRQEELFPKLSVPYHPGVSPSN